MEWTARFGKHSSWVGVVIITAATGCTEGTIGGSTSGSDTALKGGIPGWCLDKDRSEAACADAGMECGVDPCGNPCGSCLSKEVCNAANQCEPSSCVPSCSTNECGDDGCGGSCGTCAAGTTCVDGTCISDCVPNCDGNECGDDGCGGLCGSCASHEACSMGLCQCQPDCTGRTCGDDGCGGLCGACVSPSVCNSQGQCECTPSCAGKTCGDDGCGGSCGACAAGESCSSGVCVSNCVPDCGGLECGDDGCGGSCGTCASGEACSGGLCVCQPDCSARACGDDGCGGSCGACSSGLVCDAAGHCVSSSSNNLAFITSRTSGVAPLAVHFDASDLSFAGVAQPFYEMDFRWNFGDPGRGNWRYGNKGSKNTAIGPIAAHVFEAPGTYTVTLTATDPLGNVSSGTTTITVNDPDVHYGQPCGSGPCTVVISNTQNESGGDWSGAPTGALRVGRESAPTWTTIRSYLQADTRVLLRRGETWTVLLRYEGEPLDEHKFGADNTGGTLGAFGSGPKPELHVTNTSSTRTLSVFQMGGADWRIMDLAFFDDTVNDAIWLDDDSGGAATQSVRMMEHVLVLRCETTNFNSTAEHALNQVVPDKYTTGRANGPFFWVEHKSIWTTADSKKLGQFLLDYERSAMMGSSFQHQPGGEGMAHFNVRFMWVRRTVFSNNRIFGNQDRRQSTFRIHAPRWDTAAGQTNPNYQHMYSEKFVMTGNEIDVGASGTWLGTVEKQDQRFRDLLIERNYWHSQVANNYDSLIEINTPNLLATDTLHIRRNVFMHANAQALCLDIRRRNGDNNMPKNTRGIITYNNTFYTNDTNSSWRVIYLGSDVEDMSVHSNLAHGGGISSITLVDDDSGLGNVDHNVLGTSAASNWFVSASPILPADFQLNDASVPAVNAARSGEPSLYQFDGTAISYGTNLDAGAWEY